MSEAGEAGEVAAQARNMVTTLGLRVLERSAERCVVEMPYSEAAQQPLGLFHAGAIYALADSAATQLLLQAVADRAGVAVEDLDDASFPLGIALSGNIVRARRDCALRAEATPSHVGRSTAVVETKVRDEDGVLVATVTTTHFLAGGR